MTTPWHDLLIRSPAEMPALAECALVVVDLQNDFCSIGGTADRRGEDLTRYPSVIAATQRLRHTCRAVGVPVIHVQMLSLPNRASNSPAWERLRQRSLAPGQPLVTDDVVTGTWGAEFVAGLEAEDGEPVVTKYRSSGFYDTRLEDELRATGAQSLLVVGCTTEGCVESTARDATFRDFRVLVPVDCVGSNRHNLHDASLLVMGSYRAELVYSTDVIAAWSQ